MKKIALIFILLMIASGLFGCSNKNNKQDETTTEPESQTESETTELPKETETTKSETTKTQESTETTIPSETTKKQEETTQKPNETEATQKPQETESPEPNETDDIVQKTKDYILNGQEDKAEAEKLKWSRVFLDKVDISKLYQTYLSEEGAKDDIESFALYITRNAPISDNWKELFESELYSIYEKQAVRYEETGENLYQVYVDAEGTEVPYVVVSSRTDYFHG